MMVTSLTRVGVSMSGFAVECGWAIGEAVMIPHLLGLHLAPSVASLIFLVNPLFSVILGPKIGEWSDRTTKCNRRKPFLVAFSVFAFLGFACLIASSYVSFFSTQIALVYVAFGVSDLCHDLMLIPGRALLLDMTMDNDRDVAREKMSRILNSTTGSLQSEDDANESASGEEQANATYTQVQLWGRLIGLAVVSFPVEEIFHTSLEWTHFQTALSFSAVVMVASTAIVLCTSRDRPYDLLLSPSMVGATSPRRDSSTEHPFMLYEEDEYDDPQQLLPMDTMERGEDKTNCWAADEQHGSSSNRTPSLRCSQWIDLCVVLFVTFIMWFGNIAFCFWGTSWLGLDTKLTGTTFSLPLVIMATQTLVGILVLNGPLSHLNRWFGKGHVWLFASFGYTVCLGSCRVLGAHVPVLTLFVMCLGGVSIACNSSNVYSIVRDIVNDEDSVGWAIGMANNTMPVAQILVGGLTGLMVDCSSSTTFSPAPSSFNVSGSSIAVVHVIHPVVPVPTRMQQQERRVVCPEIGTVLFWWVGIVGAALIAVSYLVDVACLNGRVFRDTARKNERRRHTTLGTCNGTNTARQETVEERSMLL